MATLTFKKGSTPYTLHTIFSEGKSLTHDEAFVQGVRHLSQRIADLKKKFEEAGVKSPIMVIDEHNERGGVHARYFYRGAGCEHEFKDGARSY
jgi:hypothetical protein